MKMSQREPMNEVGPLAGGKNAGGKSKILSLGQQTAVRENFKRLLDMTRLSEKHPNPRRGLGIIWF
jgi:hypothetical protein